MAFQTTVTLKLEFFFYAKMEDKVKLWQRH
jgi:hypothetical protein